MEQVVIQKIILRKGENIYMVTLKMYKLFIQEETDPTAGLLQGEGRQLPVYVDLHEIYHSCMLSFTFFCID